MRPRAPTPGPPASATHQACAWAGFAAMIAATTALNFWPPTHEIAYLALIVMAATALGVFVPDLAWQKVQRRVLLPSPAPASWPRVLTKFAGLVASIGFIAICYASFPEYRADAKFYAHYWLAIRTLLPACALLALPYLYFVDRRMPAPCDGLWQTGRLVLGRWTGLDGRLIGQHLLGWLVKGFFLPLMFTYFCGDLDRLLHYDVGLLVSFRGFYDWAYFTLYFVDVALVSMTYLMSLRAADTHIRSTEPTALGWLVALVCYQPFWSLLGGQYLAYDSGRSWGVWLAAIPWLYDVWGSLILVLVAIYVWATISFGARFSNLTHRGIITNGPYRYSKHPAYLAKGLSWWLISMPFMISEGVLDSVRRCLLLLLLNGVYYLRAKTEERHLALDPVYVRYADWIAEHGVLRILDRIPIVGALARWRPEL